MRVCTYYKRKKKMGLNVRGTAPHRTLIASPYGDRRPSHFIPTLFEARETQQRNAIVEEERRDWESVGLWEADPLGDNGLSWDVALGSTMQKALDSCLLLQLLPQLKIGCDVSNITIPVSLCEPRSFIERGSDMFAFPSLLAAIHLQPTPWLRMAATIRWYLSGFRILRHGMALGSVSHTHPY